jgi:hypothetical protein
MSGRWDGESGGEEIRVTGRGGRGVREGRGGRGKEKGTLEKMRGEKGTCGRSGTTRKGGRGEGRK